MLGRGILLKVNEFKLFSISHLNQGGGLDCASHINVLCCPIAPVTLSTCDRGGRRGGLPPTGSMNKRRCLIKKKFLTNYNIETIKMLGKSTQNL